MAEALAPSRAATANAATTSRRWAPPWTGRESTPAKRCSSSTARPAGAPARLELQARRRHASARRRQRASWSAKGAPGALAGRVAAQAMRAPRPECTPVSYRWRRMSAPRLEKAAEQLGPDAGHFCRAARPAGPPHAKAPWPIRPADGPRRPLHAAARCAAIPLRSQALQRPSAPWTRFATTTWLWTCGSPFRLTPCVNTAATAPLVGSTDPGGTRLPGGRDGVLFEIRKRPRDGLVVHHHDRARRLGAGQCEEHAGRLRRTEGQIERRDGHASRTEHEPGARMAALEQPTELVGPDGTGEAEPLRPRSRPSEPGPATGSSRARSDR